MENLMGHCSEFAVFSVSKENLARVIKLSESLFAEINAHDKVIISHEILQKTDNPQEICWHIIWSSEESVKLTAQKWATFPSSKALESLVDEKRYYGHFIPLI
ncbi:MAG: quinol monooxygenase YgiN [Psychromonas sp.]|jgi:quinol monooxygenase YgiN